MVLSFFSPAELLFEIAGPEATKDLAGKNVLRLIQIRLTMPSLAKISSAGLYDLGLSGQVLHADTQPQPHPALLRLSAMISQSFTRLGLRY